MKKILIGLAGVALLGGGAGGGYMYLKKPAEASIPAEEDEDHAKEEKSKKGKDDHGGESEFVQLSPLILPLVDKSGLSQVISVVVAVEVGSGKDADKVRNLEPKLKDAFISEMYGVLHNYKGMQEGNVVRVDVLKHKLNKIGKRVLGEDVVKDVLLQVVQQRPV